MTGFLSGQVISLCVLVVLGALPSFSQTNTGRIVGTINDVSGAVIPGADIVVRNPTTGLTRSVITNESGTYQVPLLPPAVYEVEAALAGFRKEVRSGVTVQGLDSLLWALVEAEYGTISESTRAHFLELKFEVARLLRRLVEDLPDPDDGEGNADA